MAINPQKLLPAAKIKSSSGLVKVGKLLPTLYTGDFKPKDEESKVESKVEKEVKEVKKKVIDINKIVSDNNLLRKKENTEKRIETEDDTRDEKEKEKENKKIKFPKLLKINIPQLGIMDAINRFILFTFIGWATERLLPLLPKLLEFVKFIDPVIKFIEIFAGNVFESIVNFIDFGYKAYDTVRGFTKTIGGEQFQKTFDDFSKNLNTFINLALIAGMISTGGGKKKPPKVGAPKGRIRPGEGGRPKVTTSGGKGVGRPDIRNPLRERPKITGDTGRVDLKNPLREGPKITGDVERGAAKNVGKGIGKIGKFGVPIIGPLIDFGIRTLVFKENPGKAAAGAVGAAVGQALGGWIGGIIGGVAGSVVPIIGNILGGAAGGITDCP